MVLPVGEGFQQGVLSERYAQQWQRGREQRDANDALASWQRYATDLEQRLAQAQAESYAAQYQRNVLAEQLDSLQAEIRRLDPKNHLGNEAALIEAGRQRVDRHLATKGLQIDRSNPKVFAVKGQLR